MKYKILFLCVLFTGCAELPDENTNVPVQINQGNVSVEKTPKPMYNSRYYGDELIKNVNHYAKWLTQDLFSNIDFPSNSNSNSDIYIVANFALLDSNLNKTNHFGRQMTEAMIHEVHNTGFSVIDLKASGFIRMTDIGDVFYQSADYRELSPASDASHVITGTLTKHQGGYFV
ncbi:MAG: FlgO family outer membrane protein, partial [Colwellia sp.]